MRAELRALLTASQGQSPLRGVNVERPGATEPLEVTHIPRDPETNQVLLRVMEPTPAVGPVLDSKSQQRVDTLIAERGVRAKLLEAGLQPSRSVLLSGPPGVGKTLTAGHIAEQMKLPLLAVDLAAVMSSYLGRTGRNLRTILDFASQVECVLFIDEFDALAKRREDDADVGELKRLVNVLLLELDRWPADSFLIAATNHKELLDSAISRRFDVLMELPLPALSERKTLVSSLPPITASDVSANTCGLLALATDGLSHSDISRLCNEVARETIVRHGGLTDFEKDLVGLAIEMLRDTAAEDAAIREEVAVAASVHLGFSHRKIARILGVSHPTVSRAIATHGERK
ncbi:AAA family ATPase [Streptomyces vinaceus]|uniref:AAA family ATPase n=1 Tax=Streptomyces vinaceus TaxID=1960 RepID=UPI0035DBED0C